MNYKDKDYHKQKSKEHYLKYKQKYNERNALQKERTKEIIKEAKISGCIVCNEKEPACLDFHHLHGKDVAVSSMLGYNEAKVRSEILKCVVLCSNCHRKHHAGLLDVPG